MIPSPLHPALAHFPIAFVILGAILAGFSFFLQKRNLIIATAIILITSSLSTFIAMTTGNNAKTNFLDLYPQEKATVEQHAKLGESLTKISFVAAILSTIPIIITKNKRINSLFRFLTF